MGLFCKRIVEERNGLANSNQLLQDLQVFVKNLVEWRQIEVRGTFSNLCTPSFLVFFCSTICLFDFILMEFQINLTYFRVFL